MRKTSKQRMIESKKMPKKNGELKERSKEKERKDRGGDMIHKKSKCRLTSNRRRMTARPSPQQQRQRRDQQRRRHTKSNIYQCKKGKDSCGSCCNQIKGRLAQKRKKKEKEKGQKEKKSKKEGKEGGQLTFYRFAVALNTAGDCCSASAADSEIDNRI